MTSHRYHSSYYKTFIGIALIFCSYYQLSALNWIVVTSEADSGPGTLREAIELSNLIGIGVGSDEIPAIAFDNTVHTILLESNLPPITSSVIIDGLAVVSNGSIIREGNCALLPYPVENSQGFSAGIRVTINGNFIPDTVDSNERWGLSVLSGNVTIRGIAIINISAPAEGSFAAGIHSDPTMSSILVECCEINHIYNAGRNTLILGSRNRAVGIDTSPESPSTFINQNAFTIQKCYIHNIEGGSILECDGSDDFIEEIMSGNAYGISYDNATGTIEHCKIECITSGGIYTTCNTNFRAQTGASAGIREEADAATKNNNSLPSRAVIGSELCQNDSTTCIRYNQICSIFGGSVNANYINIGLDITAGILLKSVIDRGGQIRATNDHNIIIQNNTISAIYSGSVTTLEENSSLLVSFGTFGISIEGTESLLSLIINQNNISDVLSGPMNIKGNNSEGQAGRTYGLFISQLSSTATLVEDNQIASVKGTAAHANGICSRITASFTTGERHSPGGNQCAQNNNPLVAGICLVGNTNEVESMTSKSTKTSHSLPSKQAHDNIVCNNNSVRQIHGGIYKAEAPDSKVTASSTAGIYIQQNQAVECSQNTVNKISGVSLSTTLGSFGALKQDGSVGILVNSPNIIATNNTIAHVCEGTIHAAQHTLGMHATDIFFGLTKCPNTENNSSPTTPYAPVVTSGLAIVGAQFEVRSCQTDRPLYVENNSISEIVGGNVTGGDNPLGSIAVGLWIQPFRLRPRKSFESCLAAQQTVEFGGNVCNNTIDAITGGTLVPAYGVFLDGTANFFASEDMDRSLLVTLDSNYVTRISSSDKQLPCFTENPFTVPAPCVGTDEPLGTLDNQLFFPFLPFEPSSGIYTLFGDCSKLTNNTIQTIKSHNTDARGITTAASSDMLITNNSCSGIQGYGIFIGGTTASVEVVQELGTDPEQDLTLESFASVRNKIHTNSTYNNTNQGIKLGLIDWNNAIFGIRMLNVCPIEIGPGILAELFKNYNEPEEYVSIYGNHGQPKPCLTNIIYNKNGTLTIDLRLQNTHRLTHFTVQFFRNNSPTAQQGIESLSNFDDPQFVLTTDFNGNAFKRFTFIPETTIQKGDSITAHVTVNDLEQSAISSRYFCDTSEFGGKKSTQCTPKHLVQKQADKQSNHQELYGLLRR